MKWFKHFSNAKYDKRIMRLINKYGLKGYGVYFAIVESIAFQLETNSPIPDLEEEAEDIALFFNEDTLKIEEIIKFCLNTDLFEYNKENKRIMCLKLLTHLDNTMSNNPEIKKILDNFKKLEETSINLKQIRLDKIKLDYIKLDNIKNVFITKEEYDKLINKYTKNIVDYQIESLSLYIQQFPKKGNKYSSHYATIANWIRNEKKRPKLKSFAEQALEKQLNKY